MTDAPPLPGQPAFFIDAQELRHIVSSQPFEGGLLSVDPTATVVVTNWRADEHDPSGAVELLCRSLGRDELPDPDVDGNLVIPAADPLSGTPSIAALRQIYARLRRPDGCPWDREQTELSTLPHIIEETDELREALQNEDWNHAAEELGDVLGNVIMIAQIAHERGAFTFEDVVAMISTKLVRRHPHVFGDLKADSADDVLAIWNQVKEQERLQQAEAINNGEATDTR